MAAVGSGCRRVYGCTGVALRVTWEGAARGRAPSHAGDAGYVCRFPALRVGHTRPLPERWWIEGQQPAVCDRPPHRAVRHGPVGVGCTSPAFPFEGDAGVPRRRCAPNDGLDGPCSVAGYRPGGWHRSLGCAGEHVADPEEFRIGKTARRERAVVPTVAVDDRDLPVTVEKPHDLGVAAGEWVSPVSDVAAPLHLFGQLAALVPFLLSALPEEAPQFVWFDTLVFERSVFHGRTILSRAACQGARCGSGG